MGAVETISELEMLGHPIFEVLQKLDPYHSAPFQQVSGGENPYIILFESYLSSARSSALLPRPQFQPPRVSGKLTLLLQSFRYNKLVMNKPTSVALPR